MDKVSKLSFSYIADFVSNNSYQFFLFLLLYTLYLLFVKVN